MCEAAAPEASRAAVRLREPAMRCRLVAALAGVFDRRDAETRHGVIRLRLLLDLRIRPIFTVDGRLRLRLRITGRNQGSSDFHLMADVLLNFYSRRSEEHTSE